MTIFWLYFVFYAGVYGLSTVCGLLHAGAPVRWVIRRIPLIGKMCWKLNPNEEDESKVLWLCCVTCLSPWIALGWSLALYSPSSVALGPLLPGFAGWQAFICDSLAACGVSYFLYSATEYLDKTE